MKKLLWSAPLLGLCLMAACSKNSGPSTSNLAPLTPPAQSTGGGGVQAAANEGATKSVGGDCGDQVNADLTGVEESACKISSSPSLDQLKTCRAAVENILAKYPNIDCNATDTVSGETAQIKASQVQELKSKLDSVISNAQGGSNPSSSASASPIGGSASLPQPAPADPASLPICDSATRNAYQAALQPCSSIQNTSDIAQCRTSLQDFLNGNPTVNCRKDADPEDGVISASEIQTMISELGSLIHS